MKTMRLLNLLLVAVLAVTGVMSCGEKQEQTVGVRSDVDSVINDAHKRHDYARLLELADQYEASGQITNIQADYWRGYSYSRQRLMRLSEKYWKQAINAEIHNKEGMKYFAKSANRLSGALLLKGEYEATMKIATPALEKMSKAGYRDNSDFAYRLWVAVS